MFCKVLYNTQRRAVISERWETRWALHVPQLAALKESTGLWCRQGACRQSPAVLLSWGNGTESRETQVARIVITEYSKVESYTERERERTEAILSQIFSWVLINICMWGNYPRLAKKKKKTPERIRGNSTWSSHRTGNSTSSHQSDWKNLRIRGVETLERSCIKCGE